MPNDKNAPRKDGQVEDLPQRKVSKNEGEQVKGGMINKPVLDYKEQKPDGS